MSLVTWLGDRLRGERPGQAVEDDAPADTPVDTAMARSRATGGVPDPDAGDSNSTTGTTPSETFVGRPSSDEPGDAGPDGAELRARHGEADGTGRA